MELLAENDIEASRADALMSRIDQLNSSVKAEWLTDGFEAISPAKTKYDVYDMQEKKRQETFRQNGERIFCS